MISCVAWSHDEINDNSKQTICKNQLLFTKKKIPNEMEIFVGEKIMHHNEPNYVHLPSAMTVLMVCLSASQIDYDDH